MAGEDQHRGHESDHQPIRRLASGFRHSHARGSQIREGLPYPGERLPSAQWIHHRAHLQQSIRVGEERARSRRVRTENPRKDLSAFDYRDSLLLVEFRLQVFGRNCAVHFDLLGKTLKFDANRSSRFVFEIPAEV